MDDIKKLTAKQAREKLAARQDELGKVFEEAGVTLDSGEKGYDFGKVTCLGDDVKGSVAVAEKVKAMNAECEELAEHAETLEGAEKAAAEHAEREKFRKRPPFPGGGKGNHRSSEERIKSLGEMVAAEKDYQDWAAKGAPGQLDLTLPEAWPSDLMAKASQFETMGSKALMTTATGYAPETIRLPGYVEAASRPIQLLDLIPLFRTTQAAVTYMEETTRTHAAAETAEGAAFAESAFQFTPQSSPVRKITDSVPVTDEQLEDVAMVEGYLDSRVNFGIRQRADSQVLVGNGTAPNLRGIKNVTGIQTHAKGADPAMDAFYKAMTKIRLVGRVIATHHVMHPNDWQDIRLTRTTDGIYIFGPPTDAGPERLWGLPVVQQDADAEGTGYVGSFQPATIALFERKGVEIMLGYVNDQFARGQRTVRGDMRMALTCFRPPAFCEVTGI